MSSEPLFTTSSPAQASRSRRRKPGSSAAAGAFPQGIQAQDGGPLQDEIRSLRESIRRMMDEMECDPPLQDKLKILDALGKGGVRLCTLLKADRELGGAVDFPALVRNSMGSALEEWRNRPPWETWSAQRGGKPAGDGKRNGGRGETR